MKRISNEMLGLVGAGSREYQCAYARATLITAYLMDRAYFLEHIDSANDFLSNYCFESDSSSKQAQKQLNRMMRFIDQWVFQDRLA